MKHLLNDMSQDEMNSIREQHLLGERRNAGGDY